jgi:hypothetical protein
MLKDQIGGLQQGIAQLLQDYVTIDELLRDHARSVGWKMMHRRAGQAAASGAAYFLPFEQKISRNLLLFHHCKSFGNPRSARNWRRIALDE